MGSPTLPIPVGDVGEFDWLTLHVLLENGKITLFRGEVYEIRETDLGMREYRLTLIPYDGRELVFRTNPTADPPVLVDLPYYDDANLEIGPDGARTGIRVAEILTLERTPEQTLPPLTERDQTTPTQSHS